jgi:hypothetical protein
MDFGYHERKQAFLAQQQREGALVISKPLDAAKINAAYQQYKIQREVLRQQQEATEKWQKQQKQERQTENQIRYSLKPVKTSADRECCICGAHIPKNSRVLHRSGIETNPRTHNPRWASYYFCSSCRPLGGKQ